jgi:GNAT superfamily N-acetyltransferase
MYVRPTHRGQGAARALAAAAITFARESGCERIVLDTEAERLSAAAALYRSLGFKECEPYASVDYERPTFMELRLKEATSG